MLGPRSFLLLSHFHEFAFFTLVLIIEVLRSLFQTSLLVPVILLLRYFNAITSAEAAIIIIALIFKLKLVHCLSRIYIGCNNIQIFRMFLNTTVFLLHYK